MFLRLYGSCSRSEAETASKGELSARHSKWKLQHLNVGTCLFLPDLQAAASSTPVTIYSVNPSHRPSMQFETAPHSCLLLICKASLRLFSTSKSFKGIYHTLVTVFCINTYIKNVCAYIHMYVSFTHTHTKNYIYLCMQKDAGHIVFITDKSLNRIKY